MAAAMSPTYAWSRWLITKPEIDVQLDRAGVIGVDVKHAHKPAVVEVVEAGDHQLPSQARVPVGPGRVDGNDVDLAERWVGLGVDLGPAEPVELAVGSSWSRNPAGSNQASASRCFDRGQIPTALLRVPVEGPIVDLEPGVLVHAHAERASDQRAVAGVGAAARASTGSGRRIW